MLVHVCDYRFFCLLVLHEAIICSYRTVGKHCTYRVHYLAVSIMSSAMNRKFPGVAIVSQRQDLLSGYE